MIGRALSELKEEDLKEIVPDATKNEIDLLKINRVARAHYYNLLINLLTSDDGREPVIVLTEAKLLAKFLRTEERRTNEVRQTKI